MIRGNDATAAMERAMKVQEVILRAMDGQFTWYQAAEILGITDRQMRRFKERHDTGGVLALQEMSRKKPCVKDRVAYEIEEAVCNLALEQPA